VTSLNFIFILLSVAAMLLGKNEGSSKTSGVEKWGQISRLWPP